jgi:hypothetical protein
MNSEENAKIVKDGLVDANFPVLYEEAMENFIKAVVPKDSILKDHLKDKRMIGLKKYGEASFQSSLHNAMNSPTLAHAKDELLDCMNYLMHEIVFKANILYPKYLGNLRDTFLKVYAAWDMIYRIELDS